MSEQISLHSLTLLETRSVGCLLTSMIGDILGASVEGWDIPRVRMFYPNKLRDYVPSNHMGSQGVRYGMYTDDTNSSLALATSLVEKNGLEPAHTAKRYADFWKDPPNSAYPIGYPPSAKAVLQAVLDGKDYKETGRLCFKDGSFANGAAMRICPVGIAFRNATEAELHRAVRWAVISSHVHPEAVDAAWLQASAVAMLSKIDAKDLEPLQFLQKMRELSRNDAMQAQMDILLKYFNKTQVDDRTLVRELGNEFQLRAIEAFPCAIWAVINNWNAPELCVIDAVNMAGDADTVGCIAGAMIGALHGHTWIPSRWWSNIQENLRGRSYCVDIAQKLCALDLHDVILTEQELVYEKEHP